MHSTQNLWISDFGAPRIYILEGNPQEVFIMQLISTVQIGKNGINENTIEIIKSHFKNHQNVKVVLLKSSGRDKNKAKKIADEILEELGKNYTYRVVGFTIFIKKWRKPQR